MHDWDWHTTAGKGESYERGSWRTEKELKEAGVSQTRITDSIKNRGKVRGQERLVGNENVACSDGLCSSRGNSNWGAGKSNQGRGKKGKEAVLAHNPRGVLARAAKLAKEF